MEKLEVERNGIVEEIAKKENRMNCKNITENDVRSAYKKARALYLSGDLDERRQLINLYLNRIVIFKEYVEVYINTLPRKLATEQENTGHSEPVTGDTPNPKWAVGSVCGGGEGSKNLTANPNDGELLSKQERTEFESFALITAILIGRWTLNYKLEENL